MSTSSLGAPELLWIADDIRDRILDTVRARLANEPGPLGADPAVSEQVCRQTAGVLEEIGALRADRSPDGAALSVGIGAARASRAVHPSHSLRAAAILFDVSLPEVGAAWHRAGVPDAHERAARLLHRATVGRIADGAVGYVNTLLERLHRSHIDERQRISRELHDRVGHAIAVAMQQLDLAAHGGGAGTVPLRTALEEALGDVRRLSGELRREVDADGLRKAVERLVDEAVPHHWECRVDVRGAVDTIPRPLAEEIYLTVREAVRNAVAHAGTGTLHVTLDAEGGRFHAEVTDTGRGFVPGRPARTGTGLQSMRERVDLLCGDLVVDSEPGCGTSVRFCVPLPRLPG